MWWRTLQTMMPRAVILFVIITVFLVCHADLSSKQSGKKRKASTTCKDGVVVYDRCKRRCICKNGKLTNCCRERKDFTSMTHSERKIYTKAIYKASTDKRFKKKYHEIVSIHERIFEDGIHKAGQFLPWHRWYLLYFENFMRKVDCRFTIPYWDWSYYRDNPFSENKDDVWSPEDHGLGGNGREEDECVTTGPFAYTKWKAAKLFDKTCLQRKFNANFTLPSLLVLLMPPDDFDYFEWFLRNEIHDYVHDMICGHMCSYGAPTDPFFWLHHGFIDKLWDEWQRKSKKHKIAYYKFIRYDKYIQIGKLKTTLFIDSMNLPGGVRVCYVDTWHAHRKRELQTRGQIDSEKQESGSGEDFITDDVK